MVEHSRELTSSAQPLSKRQASELDARWRGVLNRLEDTVQDICALMAIYVENCRQLPVSTARPGRRALAHGRQAVLRDFVIEARRQQDKSQTEFGVAVISLLTVCLTLFIAGLVGNIIGVIAYDVKTEIPYLTPAMQAALTWSIGCAFTYGPAAFFSWHLRSKRVSRGTWQFYSDTHALFPAQQYVILFILMYIVTALSLTLFNFLNVYFQSFDESLVLPRFLDQGYIGKALLYAVLGAIYACGTAMIFDAAEVGGAHSRAARNVAIGTAAALGGWCFFAAFNQVQPHLAPDNWAWIIVLYFTGAAAVFGAVATASMIGALRKLNRIQLARASRRRDARRFGITFQAAE